MNHPLQDNVTVHATGTREDGSMSLPDLARTLSAAAQQLAGAFASADDSARELADRVLGLSTALNIATGTASPAAAVDLPGIARALAAVLREDRDNVHDDYLTVYDMAVELAAATGELAASISDDTGTKGPSADRAADLACLLACTFGSGPAPADLGFIGQNLNARLTENRREAVTDENGLDVQALVVAEEAGELVGAYRRWAGKARRTGSLRDLEDEIADVLIATSVFADRAGIDVNAAVRRKLAAIHNRGWRDDTGPTEGGAAS